MQQAALVAASAAAMLRAGGQGRVLSAHRRALNLILAGRFLAVVAPELGPSPWALLAPPPSGGYDAILAVGDPVACDGEALRTPVWAVRFAGAPLWQPVPLRPEPAPPAARRAAIAALDAALAGRQGALAVEGLWAPALRSRLAGLASALAAGDPAGAGAAAARLVGLGPGATPAGDDLLAGCTAALVLMNDWGLLAPGMTAVAAALAAVCRDAAGQTTAIAAAELAAAAAGALVAPAGELIAALAAGGADTVARCAGQLLTLGHTSGADLAQGIRLAMQSLAA